MAAVLLDPEPAWYEFCWCCGLQGTPTLNNYFEYDGRWQCTRHPEGAVLWAAYTQDVHIRVWEPRP